MIRRPPRSTRTDTLFPYTTLFRSEISGFNPTGPEADRPAYDIIIAAMSGLMSVTGETDGRPLRPNAPMIDFSTGAYAVMGRSEEHTSELQSLMRISYAVFCLKKKKKNTQ